MTSKDFVYWLQGLFELSDPQPQTLNATQTDLIRRHLQLVFKHEIDPSYSSDPQVQQEMQDIHDGKVPDCLKPIDPPPTLTPEQLQDIADKVKNVFKDHKSRPGWGSGNSKLIRC